MNGMHLSLIQHTFEDESPRVRTFQEGDKVVTLI